MFQTLEILDSLHTKFQSGVFIADDHGVLVHLEARDGPHMVDTFFDALGESEGLVATVDNDNNFLGMVVLDDIRNIMFRPELYKRFHVSKFMVTPPAKIELGLPMEQVMRIFDETNAWNLPVVENGKYIGFVSKSKIFNSYRRVLVHYSED